MMPREGSKNNFRFFGLSNQQMPVSLNNMKNIRLGIQVKSDSEKSNFRPSKLSLKYLSEVDAFETQRRY